MNYIPEKLTPAKIKQLRKRWASGWTARELCEAYNVKPNYITRHCKDLPKNCKRGRKCITKEQMYRQPMPLIIQDREISTAQLKQHMPHFLLYLFCRGEMSNELMSEMGDQNRSLAKDLREASEGLTLDEIIRDMPLLLLRNLIRQEKLKPFKRPGVSQVSEDRTMGEYKVQADLDAAVGDTDPDLFDPKSELMRATAATAIHYALNPPEQV